MSRAIQRSAAYEVSIDVMLTGKHVLEGAPAGTVLGTPIDPDGEELNYELVAGAGGRYDVDGSGAKAAVQIATLTKNLKLTAADFFVI